MSNIIKEISIPADNDGYSLLQCQLCGEFFKLIPGEVEEDDVIQLWCPCCGLVNENLFTDEVVELAMKITENKAMDMIFDEMKKWEKQFKGSIISFKAGKKTNRKEETPIIAGIENLEVQKYECCGRRAKIKPIVKMSGSYCPYCGVSYYGNK